MIPSRKNEYKLLEKTNWRTSPRGASTPLDVCDEASMVAFAEEVLAASDGSVGALVNNAGYDNLMRRFRK